MVRTSAGPRVDHLEAHLRRMARSAAALGIRFEADAWTMLVGAVAAEWAATVEAPEATLKLVLTRGSEATGQPTGFATVSTVPSSVMAARRDGIDVVVLSRGIAADAFAGGSWLLGGVKTLSYAVNMAAQREAQRRGAHDALFVSTDGQLLEAPTSSVVWVSGRTIATVAAGANGILRSITTDVLLDGAGTAGLTASRTAGTVDDLRAADLVMLVGSVRGPVRIRSLDGTALRSPPSADATLTRCRQVTGFA